MAGDNVVPFTRGGGVGEVALGKHGGASTGTIGLHGGGGGPYDPDMEKRMEEMGRRLDDKITNAVDRLSDKIDGVEGRLGDKIDTKLGWKAFALIVLLPILFLLLRPVLPDLVTRTWSNAGAPAQSAPSASQNNNP